jgi:very-short-patch-repair endonuclease
MASPERERAISTDIRRKSHAEPVDGAIAVLAGRQYGVVSRAQLLELGVEPGAIDRRVTAKRLHRLYAGVYAVGHTRVCREGRWLAAVLACGEGAVLSHKSAAALWGIYSYEGRIEVTATHPHRRGRHVAIRRSRIAADEIAIHRGIPATTPERTLLDLSDSFRRQPYRLDRAMREAEHLRLADFAQVEILLERYPKKRGAKHLRAALATAAEAAARTRSDLEDRFRALILEAELPTPLFNASIALDEHTTIEPDVLWPDHKVIVELDGYASHGTRTAFVADRARDRKAQLAGYAVLRFSSEDLDDRELRKLLSERTPRRSGRPRSGARRA